MQWTQTQTRQLIEWRSNGESYPDIAERLGITLAACTAKGKRLGLTAASRTKRSPARAPLHIHKIVNDLPEVKRRQIVKMAKSGMTAQAIGESCNLKPRHVYGAVVLLGASLQPGRREHPSGHARPTHASGDYGSAEWSGLCDEAFVRAMRKAYPEDEIRNFRRKPYAHQAAA